MITYDKKDIPEHLQKYFEPAELGLEKTPEEYVENMVNVFREVKRVMKDEGTLWLNLGDTYSAQRWSNKPSSTGISGKQYDVLIEKETQLPDKNLVGIPWRVAFALQQDGWCLRQDIIWHKPNPMPESVTDRCTKSHEYIFLLAKTPKYYFDNESIKEETITNDNSDRDRDNSKLNNTPGRTRMAGLKTNDYSMRNKRSVWTITTKPYKGSHFATFPEDLILPMIKAGCPEFVCKKCGKAREKIIEKEKTFQSGSGKSGNLIHGKNGLKCQGGGDTGDIRKGPCISTITTGLTNCGCNKGFEPGIVIDIFSGAGTTCMVAKKLNRNYIGIELNPEYIEMAEKRIDNECGTLF